MSVAENLCKKKVIVLAWAKKFVAWILKAIASKWIQRKTPLTKKQSRELANCIVPVLHHFNGLHFNKNRALLRVLFNEMNWKDFGLTEEQFMKNMTSITYIPDYREPIGIWFTIDSEQNYADSPKIQNTDCITYYASGREPFLAVANQIEVKNKTVLMPYFTCSTVYQPFIENGWKIVYYRVGRDLRINRQDVELLYAEYKPEIAVFLEYSGMNLSEDELHTIRKLKRAGCVTIVDRTQNIYSERRDRGIDFYCGSLRKWFCCPDGAYLEKNGDIPLPPVPNRSEYNDVYATTCSAMMFANGLMRKRRIKEYWIIGEFFRRLSLTYVSTQPVRTRNMSNYSKAVYLQERRKDSEYINARKKNVEYISRRVASMSIITPVCIDYSSLDSVPFCFYIYADDRRRLNNYLWKKGIMTWNHIPRPVCFDVLDDETEYMYQHIFALPCDQRYTEDDMKMLCDALEEYEKEYSMET